MSNKMRDARGTSKPLGTVPTKNSGTGIIGRNQAPGFSDYPQAMGKDTIPTKFAESGVGTAMKGPNKVRSATTRPNEQPKIPTTSTLKTSKNTVRSARSTKPMGSI